MKLAVKVERQTQVEEVELTELGRLAVVATAVAAAVVVLVVAVASPLGRELESSVQSQFPLGVPQLVLEVNGEGSDWTRFAEEVVHS